MNTGLMGLLDFERPRSREFALLLLLAMAVISPNIGMPGGLPAVRLEQLGLAAYLPSLALYYRHHPERWRLGLVDAAFAALAVAVTVTLMLAPVTLSAVSWSLRDPFEVARVAEYWFLYRLALLVEPRPAAPKVTVLLLVLAVVVAAFSLVQYVDPGRFNDEVTSIWTVSHNLAAVERVGRTVGTTGNPNYFGAFAGLLLVVALGVLVLRYRRGAPWLAAAAVFAATFAVWSAQSRTAVLALLFAMFVALIAVAVRRRTQAAYATGIGAFVLSSVVTIAFLELRPPDTGSFSARFAPQGLVDDSSLTVRLSQWKSIFAGFLEGAPSFCEGERFEERDLTEGHEPAATTGHPAAGADAVARDEQRREDVADITRAVLDYYCDEDEWPTGQPLEAALVPEHLDEMPRDPATGEPYRAFVDRSGFLVAATLEDESDPEGPNYALGTIPNVASNPSFETGDPPARWRTTGEITVARVNDAHLFGDRSAHVEAASGSGFFDTIVLNLSEDRDYTAAVWLRPAGDRPTTVQLYLAATMADGSVADPLEETTVELQPGIWTQASVTFHTPEEGRVTVLRFFLRNPAEGEPASFYADGATVTLGNIAPGFPRITDADPSRLRDEGLPRFGDSPIFGAGPRKDIEFGSVDNEYALFLDRYGLLGTAAYLVLFTGAFLVAWRAWRRSDGALEVLALGMGTFTILLAVFNITAGSYYHFQIMAVYWLLIGLLAAAAPAGRLFRGKRG